MGGKHSARAMQLAVQIYKKNGGGYEGKKPAADDNKLRKWTKQDWQTRPGTDPIAKRDDGRTSRYLPKSKWRALSKSEQRATDRKKLESREQYVPNTEKAEVKSAFELLKVAVERKLKNPKGGLTAAGRAHYKRTEGANLKPGVKNVSKASDGEKKRWARWAVRFYTNPRGPMTDEKGRPTRLALMANAWGTPVPKTREAAQAIAARGQRILDAAKNREKKALDYGALAGAAGQGALGGGLSGALIGALLAGKGMRAHDAAVQAIVGAVPAALFGAYGNYQEQKAREEAAAHDPVPYAT